MGLCASAPLPQEAENAVKHLKPLFDFIQLSKSQRRKMGQVFWDQDYNHNGVLSHTEMEGLLGAKVSIFVKNFYSIFDIHGTGELNFAQFVVSCWVLCTLPPKGIPAATFGIYDVDGDGIHKDTVIHLVDEAMGTLSGTNKHSSKGRKRKDMEFINLRGVDPMHYQKMEANALEKLSNADGMLNKDAFLKYIKKHPYLMKKTLDFQLALREGTLGSGWDSVLNRKKNVVPEHMYNDCNIKIVQHIQAKVRLSLCVAADEETTSEYVSQTPAPKRGGLGVGGKQQHTEHEHKKRTKAARKIQAQIRRKLVELERASGTLIPHRVKLPNGWTEHLSKSGKLYYTNSKNETQWDFPEELEGKVKAQNPANWREVVDKKTGHKYYYNKFTRCSTWRKHF